MTRSEMLRAVEEQHAPWDILVIGGGATGLGVAVDAAARGYRTILLEQHDFAKGTSSRSTKLIHGGVRYLQQGNVNLVTEALRERGLLTQNAPHLVSHLSFIVPNYTWWEAPFYGVGLKIYDLLAGKLGLGPSRHLSRQETLERLPTLEPDGLRGGTIYYDGQFDDARLAVTLARTAADRGGVLLNYCQVTALNKQHGLIRGVTATDLETGQVFNLQASAVINATGVFTDSVRQMDDPATPPLIAPSQGVHIVVDSSFLPGSSAIMVPRTDDQRVLFAIPWHGRALIGTTDTPVAKPQLEPRPLEEEIEFLLRHAARYLTKDPTRADILSAFAGLRPLVKPTDGKPTALMPRDHSVLIAESGLLTITGGKWTTYRKMAEDAIDQAAIVGGLAEFPCVTRELSLHGFAPPDSLPEPWTVYGSDALRIQALLESEPSLNQMLHPRLPYRQVEVVWAVRHEMARSVEDVLARRTRALLLDAKASIECAPKVAELLAAELNKDHRWQTAQVEAYTNLARTYLPA